jgi:hypothetical protein
MIPDIRKKYNSAFSQKRYKNFLGEIEYVSGYAVPFRISETPIFIPAEFKKEILKASEEILSQIISEEYFGISAKAIPENLKVPGVTSHPELLALDFAICRDKDGKYIPQLIELQGFPSLYCYQEFLSLMFRKHFFTADGFSNLLSGLDHDSYINLLKETILEKSNPENVILLEIEPEKQKTRIDFIFTEKYLGIKAVCLSEVLKSGKDLFYRKEGKTIRIEKIYNRVIFDELLKRKDIVPAFSFGDELSVKWIPHPDWFFRISKYTLPFLRSKYVPRSIFLSTTENIPDNLENYILKPLFSFAGSGVQYDITREDISEIKDRENYIIQKKVSYEPVIETPDIPAKAEMRILYVWKDKPIPVTNVVRLSKGKMMGVDYNKDKSWVGSSSAFFEPD